MLPESLPVERGKNHWYYTDAFQPYNRGLIQSFIHYNYNIGMHTHDFWELNIVLNGTGGHYIGKNRFEIKTGDVFIIPPKVQHGYFNINGLNVYHMLIHAQFLEQHMSELRKYGGFAALFEIEPYLRGICSKSMFLSLSGAQLKWLMQGINHIRVYYESDGSFSEALANAAAKDILSHLCFLADAYHSLGASISQNSPLNMIQCLNYIHANYDKELNIEHLAQRCSMSRASFIRAFKANCGMPPHKYIMLLRIRAARRLIAEANLSITEAAHECGFYDASHLKKYLDREKQISS